MLTKQDVLDSFESRSSHLLERVRETAQRCIDLGVRVDIPGLYPDNKNAWDAYHDYKQACDDALFELADVWVSGEMYTREDMDDAREEGYEAGYDAGQNDGYEAGYNNRSWSD
jgi:flagellar biosynthesis/type III secretory pathway protein FliH